MPLDDMTLDVDELDSARVPASPAAISYQVNPILIEHAPPGPGVLLVELAP